MDQERSRRHGTIIFVHTHDICQDRLRRRVSLKLQRASLQYSTNTSVVRCVVVLELDIIPRLDDVYATTLSFAWSMNIEQLVSLNFFLLLQQQQKGWSAEIEWPETNIVFIDVHYVSVSFVHGRVSRESRKRKLKIHAFKEARQKPGAKKRKIMVGYEWNIASFIT
jgi:hypothetical protein